MRCFAALLLGLTVMPAVTADLTPDLGSARADVPRVMTDIPPVQALAAQVLGGLGMPEALLPAGADAHDFQLRPSQMRDLAGADLLIWIGPDLTPWLDRAARGAATPQLALLQAATTRRRTYAGSGAIDPHAWLDPDNARAWLVLIAYELARIDPDNAATYANNAVLAAGEIAALDARIAADLAPLKDVEFLTFHDAYGYFTAHYGLTPPRFFAPGDASAPGAAHLADLDAALGDGQIACLFPEAQHDPAPLDQLAAINGTRIGAALDPIGGGHPPGPQAYARLIEALATSLTDCLEPQP